MKYCSNVLCVICLTFFMFSSAFAQRDKSVLLPESKAKSLTQQCSRSTPSDFSDTWKPSETDIKAMESKFSKIKKLKAEHCCIKGEQIKNLEEFYMQYAGIVIKGKKYIYINAFIFHPQIHKNWKEYAIIVCDGGSGYWGVLYDVKTGKFVDLAFNGFG